MLEEKPQGPKVEAQVSREARKRLRKRWADVATEARHAVHHDD